MTRSEPLRIGTRGSPLALAQARMVADALAPRVATEIVVVKTTGDHILDRPLAEIGGKGLFTKEIEDRLIEGTLDLAVHSMKDMPTILPKGLVIAAMLPRADPRDVLIAGRARRIADLPQGARVGTASLRRAAQLLSARPDLAVSTLRGSVQTRLARIERGDFHATLLAKAGLDRLGLHERTRHPLEPEEMLPVVAQGAVGIECVADDTFVRALLAEIDDADTTLCVEAERAFLARLDGSCRTPIAGWARIAGEGGGRHVNFDGLVASPDGRTVHRGRTTVATGDAATAAGMLGAELLSLVGPDFFTVGS